MTTISIDPGWNPTEFAESVDMGLIVPDEQWSGAAVSVPRHVFTPRWWERDGEGWTLRDGPSLATDSPGAWSAVLDTDDALDTVVTRIGLLHADDAAPGDHPTGQPTKETPTPGNVVCLFYYADVHPGCTVLLADAASGYECALLAHHLGSEAVTTLAGPEATARVQPRLAELGLAPAIVPSPAKPCNRMISAVPGPVPADCLAALSPGGQLAARLPIGTLVAEKLPDGTACGYVQADKAVDANPFNPFAGEGQGSVPVIVQPDGTIALRLDSTQR